MPTCGPRPACAFRCRSNSRRSAGEEVRTLYRRHAMGNCLYRNLGDGKVRGGRREVWRTDGSLGVVQRRLGHGSRRLSGTLHCQRDDFRAAAARLEQFFLAPGGGQLAGRREARCRLRIGLERRERVDSRRRHMERVRTQCALSEQRRRHFLRRLRRHRIGFSGGQPHVCPRGFRWRRPRGDGPEKPQRAATALFKECDAATGAVDLLSPHRKKEQSRRDRHSGDVETAMGRQTRFVQAGSGFLAQHSKELFFGLGAATGNIHATIRWPSGLLQNIADLPANHRIWIEEGSAAIRKEAFASRPAVGGQKSGANPPAHEPSPAQVETWLLVPVAAPDFQANGSSVNPGILAGLRGRTVLLYFGSAKMPDWEKQLEELRGAQARGWRFTCDCCERGRRAVNVGPAPKPPSPQPAWFPWSTVRRTSWASTICSMAACSTATAIWDCQQRFCSILKATSSKSIKVRCKPSKCWKTRDTFRRPTRNAFSAPCRFPE